MTSTAPKFRYIGLTDECVQCQCCGKNKLRATVVLAVLDAEGNDEDITYYGTTCAAKALGVTGGGRAVKQSAMGATHRTIGNAVDARRMLDIYDLPEQGMPTDDQVRSAMGAYIRNHNNIAQYVAETGIGVRVRMLDMVGRYQRALAEAALLKGEPACPCGDCWRWFKKGE